MKSVVKNVVDGVDQKVSTVTNYMFGTLSDKAFARVVKAANRRHLTVDEYLRRTASNVLRYGTTRRYFVQD